LAGAAAFLTGLVIMRLTGLAASISTLAVLFILNVVYSNWDSVTMGSASIVGLPTYVTAWLALGCAVFAIVVAYLYQISAFGLAIRATREDEVAAAASGISLYWSRLIAFTLSGFLVGLGGVLQAHYLGTVSINSFFLSFTFLALAMLIVGGMGSLAGAVVGVVVITAMVDIFRRLEGGISVGGEQWSLPAGTQELIIAGFMLLILVFRKDGIMAGRELTLPGQAKREEGLTNG
jgi:branched-chain amino acid transport system permease protein